MALPPSMPVTGLATRRIGGPRTLVARAPEGDVQLRFHEFLDEPLDPIPDDKMTTSIGSNHAAPSGAMYGATF